MKSKNILIATLAFLTSCETSSIDSNYAPAEDVAFFITQDSGCTKGTPIDNVQMLSNIGVFATLTQSPYADTSTHDTNFMSNQKVELIGDNWVYSPIREWSSEPDDLISFFAYAPYANDVNGLSITEPSGEIPTIRYQIPQTNEQQPDLMVAIPTYDRVKSQGTVGLKFRHALAAISFSVKGDPSREIKSVKLRNVIPAATLALDNLQIAWSDHQERSTQTYDLGLKDDATSIGDGNITASNGYLMMIPQDITDVAIEVVIEGESGQINLDFEPGSEWVAGAKYNYIIDLDAETVTYDISQTSNCYIVKNTFIGEIYIPIDQRINAFWRNYSGLNQKNSAKYMIDSDTEWETSIEWYDNDLLSAVTAERYTGVIPEDSKTSKSFVCDNTVAVMKVTLPENTAIGNVLIAVTKKIGEVQTILWSWHLWVTDYNPDSQIYEPSETKEYAVEGGKIHRYTRKSPIWTTGLYSRSFAMDRDIGSHDSRSVNGLFYQWGRKDPFSTIKSWTTADSQATFATAVQTPNTFYTSKGGWCNEPSGKGYNSKNYLWYDMAILKSEANAFEKSIFDPSPLGWCIPLCAAYSELGFRNDYNEIIYYDITGHIHPISGEIDEDKKTTSLWCASKTDDYTADFLYVESLSIWLNNRTTAYGHRIRPVKIP